MIIGMVQVLWKLGSGSNKKMTWRKPVLYQVFLLIFLFIKFYSIPSFLKQNMLGETHAILTTTILFSWVERCNLPLSTCQSQRWKSRCLLDMLTCWQVDTRPNVCFLYHNISDLALSFSTFNNSHVCFQYHSICDLAMVSLILPILTCS